jgi:hypothetical protein
MHKLSQKMSSCAALITRTVGFFNSPPGPMCCLALVRSILLAQFAYVAPFTRLTDTQLDGLLHIVARPLKAVVGIPSKSSSSAILCEFGLPDLKSFRELQLLLQLLRSRSGTGLTSALAQDVDQLPVPGNYNGPHFCRSIANEVADVITSWDMNSCDDKDVLKYHYSRMLDKRWSSAVTGTRLREIKPSVGLSFYLSHDAKPVVCLRARLRFDVANNSESKHKRGLSETPNCSRCGNSSDTREHLLMVCRVFDDIRTVTAEKLKRLNPPEDMTMSALLGVFEHSNSHKPPKRVVKRWAMILNITGEMLLVVNKRLHRL